MKTSMACGSRGFNHTAQPCENASCFSRAAQGHSSSERCLSNSKGIFTGFQNDSASARLLSRAGKLKIADN